MVRIVLREKCDPCWSERKCWNWKEGVILATITLKVRKFGVEENFWSSGIWSTQSTKNIKLFQVSAASGTLVWASLKVQRRSNNCSFERRKLTYALLKHTTQILRVQKCDVKFTIYMRNWKRTRSFTKIPRKKINTEFNICSSPKYLSYSRSRLLILEFC